MTEVELDVAHFKYETPNDVYFYQSGDFERADQPPEGMVPVREASMDVVLHFPCIQLSPISWSFGLLPLLRRVCIASPP